MAIGNWQRTIEQGGGLTRCRSPQCSTELEWPTQATSVTAPTDALPAAVAAPRTRASWATAHLVRLPAAEHARRGRTREGAGAVAPNLRSHFGEAAAGSPI